MPESGHTQKAEPTGKLPVPTLLTPDEQKTELMERVFGEVGAPTLHNFRGNRMEIWKQIADITVMECNDFEQVREEGIELYQFYVHGVQFVDDATGEVSDGVRCVLIPKEGVPFACVSDGIARDLSGIIRTFGFGPYIPPIRVKPVSVKTRKGFKTYRLVPMD